MFTGLYTRWDSYFPTGQKIGLIEALTTRAIGICSKDTLPGELLMLKNILEDNGYQLHVVDRTMRMTKETCAAGKAGCAVDLDDTDHC